MQIVPPLRPSVVSFRPIFAFLAATAAALAADPARPAPTLGEIFRPMAVNEARLAPDGKHLAAISTAPDGARSLLVIDLATQATETVKAPAEIDIGTVRWIDGSHLIFTSGQDDRYSYALFHGQLGKLASATRFSAHELTAIVGLPRARPNRALVWVVVPTLEAQGYNRLAEVDVNVSAVLRDGRLSKSTVARTYAAPRDGTPVGWHALENGELGYCETYADRKITLHRWDAAKDAWSPVALDLDRYHVVGVDPDPRTLWISHFEDGQGFVLQKLDVTSGAFGEPVWRDPAYDLATARLIFSRQTGQLAALAYEQRRHFTKVFAEPFASAQKAVQARYPEANVVLLNFSDDEQKFLFSVSGAQDPGRIVLLDQGQPSLEVMSEVAPWLADKALLPTFPMSYKTADGLKEEGYVTLPAGASAAHKVPLVVLVHGGPGLRDTWDFYPQVQWLASRGYAVLQPNYRGSRGYQPAVSFNARFAFARMHEDVAAATRAASALEMIDGSRVAVLGHGFGGFLALMGASFDPGLYRCAASIGGTFDWEGFVRELSFSPASRAEYELLRDFIGKPGQDRDTFDGLSPLRHVDAITAAVFLAYPENPNVVSHGQSEDLAARLRKDGKVCETYQLKWNWYDLRGRESWLELLRRIDGFLAQHLAAPGRN